VVGVCPVTEPVVEGNDPHVGHGRVCAGDIPRVGVSHRIAEVKLLCYRWLSPFIKLVEIPFTQA
jgi:hypothetical protein